MIYEDRDRYFVYLDSVLEGQPRAELAQIPYFSFPARIREIRYMERSTMQQGCTLSTVESKNWRSTTKSWAPSHTKHRACNWVWVSRKEIS